MPRGRTRRSWPAIFVCPNPDRETVIAQGRRAVAGYLNVPVYRAFHEWLGRGDLLAEHWEMWAAGDRAGSLEAIPEQVVDDLIVHGTPEECRAHIDRYFDNGGHHLVAHGHAVGRDRPLGGGPVAGAAG